MFLYNRTFLFDKWKLEKPDGPIEMDNPDTARSTISTRHRRRQTNKKKQHKTENVIDEQHGPYGKTRQKCVGANLYVTKKDPLPFENNQEFST